MTRKRRNFKEITMARTTQRIPAHKEPAKVFFAHLDDHPGVLTRVHGIIYFVAGAGEIIEITPAHINKLVTRGEMQLAAVQRYVEGVQQAQTMQLADAHRHVEGVQQAQTMLEQLAPHLTQHQNATTPDTLQ
jgi:hypothetical protein